MLTAAGVLSPARGPQVQRSGPLLTAEAGNLGRYRSDLAACTLAASGHCELRASRMISSSLRGPECFVRQVATLILVYSVPSPAA